MLSALLDKSLLLAQQDGGETRYRLLDTIRQYGTDRLREAGESDTAQREHALYYLQFAERANPELKGPHQADWLNRVEAEHDNLRAALRWALATSDIEIALRLADALGTDEVSAGEKVERSPR